MSRHLVQHVFEKTYADIELSCTATIQINIQSDLGFAGVTRNLSAAL